MFNALRRVISETSDIGNHNQQMEIEDEEEEEEEIEQHEIGHSTKEGEWDSAAQSPHSASFPHTIVMDEEDDDRKVSGSIPSTMVNSTAAEQTKKGGALVAGCQSDTSSSLSDGSVENRNNSMKDEEMDSSGAEAYHQPQVAPPFRQMERQEKKSGAVLASPAHTSGAVTESHKSSDKQTRQQQYMMSSPAEEQRIHNNTSNATSLSPASMFQRMDSVANESSNDGGSSGSHRNGTSSQTSSRDWGWFEDVHIGADTGGAVGMMMAPSSSNLNRGGVGGNNDKRGEELLSPNQDIMHTSDVDDEAAAMAVTAPTYVLEESLSSQKLWKHTAGNRPPQPLEERAFFEKMWAQNFARSQVNYSMPVEVLTASSPISLNPFADGVFEGAGGEGTQIVSDYGQYGTTGGGSTSQNSSDGVDGDAAAQAALISRMHDMADESVKSTATYIGGPYQQYQHYQKVPGSKSDGDLTVLLRGPNAFGTTVSKSFARSTENGSAIVGVDTVNISLASYRVVESKKYGKYAQFLVIYREGSIRDTVGVWKRYRDFEELSHKVTQAHEGCAAVIANMSPLAVTEEPEIEHLPNAITSWRLLKKRKRWYRCLDAGYLSLKVFLLERFLHDILFESSSPKLLRDFVLGPGTHGPR
ncbi:hypothetical protein ACA910_013272 [Epithemia clementina (nom. ined.)]